MERERKDKKEHDDAKFGQTQSPSREYIYCVSSALYAVVLYSVVYA